MNKPIKYIVAGNYNEYQAYVRRKTRDQVYYKYVSGVDRIRGLSEIDGYYIGTFYQRPDIEDIKVHINLIKSKQRIDEIKPLKYEWKDPGVGFIAQEIGHVLSDEFSRAYNGGDIEEYLKR
jgi:hypothetical protein